MGKKILLATVIIQCLVGLSQIIAAEMVFAQEEDVAIAVAQLYGISLLMVSGVSLLILLISKSHIQHLAGFVTLFIFHLGLGIAQAFALTEGYGHIGFAVVNFIFSFLFFFLMIKELRSL